MSISCWATPSSFTQLNYLAGKHWVNNNYGFYAQRQLARHAPVDSQPGPSLMMACPTPLSAITSLPILFRPTTTLRNGLPSQP